MESSEEISVKKKLWKNTNKGTKGITLIALVITIIVLLILAGVSIATLTGDNGLFRKAQKVVNSYQTESEREAIEMSVQSYQLGKNTKSEEAENEESRLGKSLVDRNVENGNKWDEVYVTEESGEKTTYGGEWNYVEEGEDLKGYGKAKHNWLVNYNTGEIIKLGKKNGEEVGDYENWNWELSVPVHDGLLLNLDPANISPNATSLGENTTLYYYDDNTYQSEDDFVRAYEQEKGKDIDNFPNGYDRNKSENVHEYINSEEDCFSFAGNNYIEIRNEDNKFDFKNGLSFVFYGNITGGKNVPYYASLFPVGYLDLWNGVYDSGFRNEFPSRYSLRGEIRWFLFFFRWC